MQDVYIHPGIGRPRADLEFFEFTAAERQRVISLTTTPRYGDTHNNPHGGICAGMTTFSALTSLKMTPRDLGAGVAVGVSPQVDMTPRGLYIVNCCRLSLVFITHGKGKNNPGCRSPKTGKRGVHTPKARALAQCKRLGCGSKQRPPMTMATRKQTLPPPAYQSRSMMMNARFPVRKGGREAVCLSRHARF